MIRIRYLPLAGLLAGLALLTATDVHGGDYKVYSTYLWHVQQPIYWPEKVNGLNRYQFAWESLSGSPTYPGHPQNNLADIFGLDDRKAVYTFRARDSVASIGQPDGGAQLSYAGSLIENVWSLGDNYWPGYYPDWYKHIREARGWTTTRGRSKLQPVGFAYHHAFMPLIDRDARIKEIAINKQIWWKAWGGNSDLSDHPEGFRCSEEAFSPRIIRELVEAGYKWVIVPNHHLSRTHPNYVQLHGKGVYDAPNKADQINLPNPGGWYSGEIDGRGSTESIPFSFQAHRARCVDPETGQEYKIIVVPMTDLGSYRDGYSQQGIDLLHLLNGYADYGQPCIALFSHDGDNAWGGGYSYYQEAVPNFTTTAAGAQYRPTTIQTFLDENPPPEDDIVHVEDGAWVNAENDWGHPMFVNWLWPPQRNRNTPEYDHNDPSTYADIPTGWAEDFRNWAVIMAAQNFVSTAEQVHELHGGTVDDWRIQEPVQRDGTDNGADAAELAWHFFLGSLDSGYMYYGASIDMEVKPTLACNQAISYAQQILESHPASDDATGPTVFNPQRYPWNPGSKNYASFLGYREWIAPSDFHIWTLAYDVSGITSCVLRVRADLDGSNPLSDDQNETFAGGAGVGSWQSYSMERRLGSSFAGNIFNDPNIDFFIMPTHIADEYWYEVTGYNNQLLDYYVEAYDTYGNVKRSDIQHVFVGSEGGGTPVNFQPVSPRDCEPLVTRYNPSGRPLEGQNPLSITLVYSGSSIVTNYDVMTQESPGLWIDTDDIPEGATGVVVRFAGVVGFPPPTDDNDGAGWSVAISACSSSDVPSSVTFDPEAPNGCDPVTIRYAPGDGPLSAASQVYLHVGRNGWQDVPEVDPSMTFDGTAWTHDYEPLPDTRSIEVAFRDGDGVWDSNAGSDWQVAVANCAGGPLSVRFAPGSPVIGGVGSPNVAGDNFDFNQSGGAALTANQGGFGSFGKIYFNFDDTNLYVGGLDCSVAGSNNAMIVFLALDVRPEDAGTLWGISGLPNGLDHLHNVAFSPPMDIAIVLGNEYGDGTFPNFNLGDGYDFGQGVFFLSTQTAAFVEVPLAQLSQFDGQGTAPTQGTNDDADHFTDRWESSIPWSSLGLSGMEQVGSCHVAGLFANTSTNGQDRYLSSNYAGYTATNNAPLDGAGNYAFSFVTIQSLNIGLPGDDSDGDGLSDEWESRFFGGPTNAVPGADGDGDGLDNLAESLLGTHPGDAASALRVAEISFQGGHPSIRWRSVGQKTYMLQYSDNLDTPGGGFQPLAEVTEDDVPGGTESEEIHIDTGAVVTARVYRVELKQ